MSRTESSDETYKPPRIIESSIVEFPDDASLEDESFLGIKSVDDNSSSFRSTHDVSHSGSSDVDDEASGQSTYVCNDNSLALKYDQKSLNKDSSYEFSSGSKNSYSRALGESEDDVTSSPKGNKAVVGSVLNFPEANKPSTISDNKFKSISKDYFISTKYTIHKPSALDHRYDVIKNKGQYGLSISRAQLECGLRLPIHPFVQKIIKQSGVSLSQLLPNSFLNINAFIDRCFDKKVKRHSAVFWTHFRLLSNKVKNPGFYTIALKPHSERWVVTPGNYHRAQKEWFYITGPDLKKFTKWSSFEAISFTPKLKDFEKEVYSKLLQPESSPMILSQRESRSEAYLIDIGVSGLDSKLDLLQKRLAAAKQREDADLKNKENKKNSQDGGEKGTKKRGRESSMRVSDKGVSGQPLMLTHGEGPSDSDAVARDGKLVTKRTKIGDHTFDVELPEEMLEKASSSSISFGKKAKTMLSLPGDQVIAQKCSRGEGFENMIGHLSQAYSWAIQLSDKDQDADKMEARLKKSYESEAKKLRKANTQIEKLESGMASLKSKVGDLEKQLSDARSNEDKLSEIIAAKTREVETAEERWYCVATDLKLKKAKELFGDAYVGLVDPWDKDPNVAELSPVDASSPAAESHSHDETMIDDANKVKTVIENNP